MSPDFIQQVPPLKNPFANNVLLKSILNTYLPKEKKKFVFDTLEKFGQRIIDEVHHWGRDCEKLNPVHVPYDPWGKRIDEIHLHESWKRLANFSAEEGLIADGYERTLGDSSRLLQMSKIFLFHPSSAFFTCPLAMTDGAAKIFEGFKAEQPQFKTPYDHLTSKDTDKFWTSGQWMTEKSGGSDVSNTSTVAKPNRDHYLLCGVKWFSSSTTSEMALALARIEGSEDGSHGLSLFYVPMRNENGTLNGVTINRLKDKMGTKALPTAELTLENSKAWLVGEAGKGVKTVTSMLNITRMYNSICSVGQMDRMIQLLTDYSKNRKVFSQNLIQQPLFKETLADQKMHLFASMSLSFEVCRLLGKKELNSALDSELVLLRLLTPITKLFTAKQAVWVSSECLEGFGGAGYVEDTEISVLFRDAQVFPIWEGATNVLSLDVLRVMRDPNAILVFFETVKKRIINLKDTYSLESEKLLNVVTQASEFSQKYHEGNSRFWQTVSRDFSWSLGEVFAGLLMLEHSAANSDSPSLFAMSQRWLQNLKFTVSEHGDHHQKQTDQILEL